MPHGATLFVAAQSKVGAEGVIGAVGEGQKNVKKFYGCNFAYTKDLDSRLYRLPPVVVGSRLAI